MAQPKTLDLAVAVIGTGSIGSRHLEILRGLPGVRPIASPKRAERAREWERRGFLTASGVEHAAELGAKLCIVASDTHRHAEDALAALERGMDILVEKPLAASGAEAARVLRRASELGRKAFVGCCLRFSASLGAFREQLGEIGALHSVRVECQSFLPDWRPGRPYAESYSARAEDGGVLRDLVHEIDYAGWIFGWPKALRADVRNLGRLGIESEEEADLSWSLPDGPTLTMRLDYLSRPARRMARACGERGTLSWDGQEGTVELHVAGAAPRRIAPGQTRDQMLRAQTEAFILSASGGPDPRLAPAEDGVKALAVCAAARRSSTSRREEAVLPP